MSGYDVIVVGAGNAAFVPPWRLVKIMLQCWFWSVHRKN